MHQRQPEGPQPRSHDSTATWQTAWSSSTSLNIAGLASWIIWLRQNLDDNMRLRSSLGLLIVLYQRFGASADDPLAQPFSDLTLSVDTIYAHDVHDAAQNPLLMGSMSAKDTLDSPRHRQEKAHLMKRMVRKHGKWTPSHPRYRLLDALYGYSRYRDQSMVGLDRWRDLYKNIGKKQKKVSSQRRYRCMADRTRPWRRWWHTQRNLTTLKS